MRPGQLVKKPLDPAKCGTPGQARAHYYRGQKPCFACRAASSVYARGRYTPKGKPVPNNCSLCGRWRPRDQAYCNACAGIG